MLKKAGIVVLGATAGMLSLAPLASAGEAPQTSGGHEGHHSSHEGGHGGCSSNKLAYSGGDNLVGLNNLAANPDVSHVNILAEDNSHDGECGGSNKIAASEGDNLVGANNLLSNADVSHVNVLAKDNSS